MKKFIRQVSVSGPSNSASDTRQRLSSGAGKLLRISWILALLLSIAGWMAVALFLNKTTWIDFNGFLHEPLFWIIPISYFFLFTALVLAAFDLSFKFWNSADS